MNFLSVVTVEALHHKSIQSRGGSSGLRDRGLLESAVNRARNKRSLTMARPFLK
jgi:prophage maintenance system killer protein